MITYTRSTYMECRKNAKILSKDRFGDKVLCLDDGSILKLFRVKRLISSARLISYAKRFACNAKKLATLGIPTIQVMDTITLPEIKRTAVRYQPLAGVTLRDYLEKNSITCAFAEKLACFVARLHNKGIYFRSIHFGNIILLPNNDFGLIDISDMKIKRKRLGKNLRVRNFSHFTRYTADIASMTPEINRFIQAYITASQLTDKQAAWIQNSLIDIFNKQKTNRLMRVVFFIYSAAWKIAVPMLRLNHRLAQGFDQRTLKQNPLQPADIWIQAASVGEAYLAWEILKYLSPVRPVRMVLTSNTTQGMEILNSAVTDLKQKKNPILASTAYFPFDNPAIMKKAIQTIKPGIIVLLESEIWPGLLFEAKKSGCKICIINGRMTDKSLKRYLIWPSLWRALKPERILAISKDDASRFKKLFKLYTTEVMSNIKFDRLFVSTSDTPAATALDHLIQPDTPFAVMGSIRKEEEKDIEKILDKILNEQPHTVIGLFPRHASRVQYWANIFTVRKMPWIVRSRINEPVAKGTIILWDTFGELNAAYRIATAVFVGGSLAPLGGQNFLEPLTYGISPVIGPSWENFSWVGTDIMTQNLVRVAQNWKEAADLLISDILHPPLRKHITEKMRNYLEDHQGGTLQATNLITHYLD